MTEWAAEQYGEQDSKGTLEVGKLADLVILDQDPLKVDPMSIRDIRVVETIKEGATIYPASASELAPKPVSTADPTVTHSWTVEACDMDDVNTAARKEWTLTTLNGQKIDTAKPPTMMFEHGRLSVFGGINQLTGSYALVRESVVMGDLVSTKKAGPPELMELESNFAKALAKVDGFKVAGNELTLFTDGDEVAVLHSAE